MFMMEKMATFRYSSWISDGLSRARFKSYKSSPLSFPFVISAPY